MVGNDHDAAVAALKSKGIAFQESSSGDTRQIVYAQADESVSLDFAPWPKDPNTAASAWDAAPRRLTLVRIRDTAPSSEARRGWVNGLAKEGRGWAYLGAREDGARAAADREKYPVAAGLQWKSPPATLLFQAARPAGTAPGHEQTELLIELRAPRAPAKS
jgi:hypothetical protein